MRRNTINRSFVIVALVMLTLPSLVVSGSNELEVNGTNALSITDEVIFTDNAITETDKESTLQEWFVANEYVINVTEDELGIETFEAGCYQIAIVAEIAAYASLNNLSWYPISSGELQLIFSGVNKTGDITIFKATEAFGLCLGSPDGLFYTETNRNPDSLDHALIFANQKQPGGYIIVWEDLWEGGDADFQDMILAMLIPGLKAKVCIYPRTLNLKSRGRWITCFITLPSDYDVEDIDVSTIMLNGSIPAEPKPVAILNLKCGYRKFDCKNGFNCDNENEDVDECNGIKVLMVKFNRTAVIEYIKSAVDLNGKLSKWLRITLTVSGKLFSCQTFEGSARIRIIHYRRCATDFPPVKACHAKRLLCSKPCKRYGFKNQ